MNDLIKEFKKRAGNVSHLKKIIEKRADWYYKVRQREDKKYLQDIISWYKQSGNEEWLSYFTEIERYSKRDNQKYDLIKAKYDIANENWDGNYYKYLMITEL